MDAIHILLGRPWQFDVDAVHRGRLNQYIIKVQDRRIALITLPSREKQELENKPKLLIQFNGKFERELK